jgi:hypothetical protein
LDDADREDADVGVDERGDGRSTLKSGVYDALCAHMHTRTTVMSTTISGDDRQYDDSQPCRPDRVCAVHTQEFINRVHARVA